MTANAKLKKLRNILKAMDSALVAFSGGTDSSFLVRVAKEEISGRLLAVTGVSKSIPVSEIDQAVSLARKLKVRHRLIADRPPKEFWANPAQRCYYCKKATKINTNIIRNTATGKPFSVRSNIDKKALSK